MRGVTRREVERTSAQPATSRFGQTYRSTDRRTDGRTDRPRRACLRQCVDKNKPSDQDLKAIHAFVGKGDSAQPDAANATSAPGAAPGAAYGSLAVAPGQAVHAAPL